MVCVSQSDHIDAALNNFTRIQHRCNPNPTRSWQWEEGIGPWLSDRAAVAKIMRVMTNRSMTVAGGDAYGCPSIDACGCPPFHEQLLTEQVPLLC